MAVETLDAKKIWESGQTYDAWLNACQPPQKQEMERHFKDAAVPAGIEQLIRDQKRTIHVLAIAEDWCGDVRRNVPVIAKLCSLNPGALKLRVVDKETKPQLMVRYLTNAAEAIPIVVFYNDSFVEVGNWGPRPAECKRLMARGKAAGKIPDARTKIGEFYAKDQHQSTIRELKDLIEMAGAAEV